MQIGLDGGQKVGESGELVGTLGVSMKNTLHAYQRIIKDNVLFTKNVCLGAGEVVRRLPAFPVLLKGLSSVLNPNIKWLTTIYSSSFRGI